MPVEEVHLMPDHVHMLQATGFAGSLIWAAVFGSGPYATRKWHNRCFTADEPAVLTFKFF